MSATKLQAKFASALAAISSALIERDDEASLAMTAMLSDEHLLLVGPPGTAKSMLLDCIVAWCEGNKFSITLNKFTTPEETSGPISLKGMKQDDYRRVTQGMLPSAHFAFLDEIFKASSAILNTTLRILNEREYRNGCQGVVKCPLRFCVAASNEWPGGEGQESLDALFDRFVIRKTVQPIATQAGRERLLWTDNLVPSFKDTLTLDELDEARAEVKAMKWSKDAAKAMLEILMKLKTAGIMPGDRRQRKAVTVAKAYAWLQGAAEVEPDHLTVLSHVLWNDPNEQPQKVAEIVVKESNPSMYAINSRLIEASQLMNQTNISDWAESTTTVAKLGEIIKQLKGVKASPKRDSAIEKVEAMICDIKRVHLSKSSE